MEFPSNFQREKILNRKSDPHLNRTGLAKCDLKMVSRAGALKYHSIAGNCEILY
jgi:hypothetical protein